MSKAKQKPLIIIEGPGKINKFKRISEGTITNGTVFATHGRLFDLPKNVIGIEFKDGKYQAEWEPIKQKLIDALKEAIKSSTEVILATDNDSEGHLIAWQISRISDAMNKPSSRIIINELTEASFSHAYDNKTQCNHVQAEPALIRRLFDRLISYNEYNDPKDNTITVSRIKSPLSKILNEGNYESSKLIITTENLSITAEVPQSHVSQVESLKVRIAKSLAQSGSQLKCDITSLAKPKSHELNSYQQNLIEFAEQTGEKVIDIHNAAQSLYEDGAISYPHTINTKIHRSTAKLLQKFAARSGQKFNINNNSILSNTESASTNHEALHAIKEPLRTCMHKNANINERLHNFIYQKTLDIGSNKIKRANTSKSAINCNYELIVILSEPSKIYKQLKVKIKNETA
ncbi:type IA DNA topoisomerase [Photobacterium leiognathi]|uniref:toprim domain-containing protein n=1 Tax=Photobacterium leiognathi TaxID=553611 RepID=UPI001EDCEF7C|nr:toprim domain-containing protein [Photobacterium leiognathi]MCG3884895.1 type IA DNA topoisomerase [Photobacterium leiognathi]